MRYEFYLFGISVLIAVIGAAGCQRETVPESPGADPVEIPAIERESPATFQAGEGQPVAEIPGTFRRTYAVPPSFMEGIGGAAGGAAAADPFAGPSAGTAGGNSTRVQKTGTDVLQEYGVTFPEKAGATYDPETGELTVVATPDELALVDAVMKSIQSGMEKMINVRVEIYEVAAVHALKLEQSAEAQDDHAPEWKAVQGLLDKGGARFITSAGIQSRSGQRSQFSDMQERIHVSDYDWVNKEKMERMVPVFDMREVGTILEVDPVLGPDDRTIDLNLSLEHHTAPPTENTDLVRFPNSDRSIEVTTPVFHVKKFTTMITILDGQVKLLGAWRPTGKPEYEAADVMQVVFLKTDVQPAFRVERIR